MLCGIPSPFEGSLLTIARHWLLCWCYVALFWGPPSGDGMDVRDDSPLQGSGIPGVHSSCHATWHWVVGTGQRIHMTIQGPYDQETAAAKPCPVEYTRKELGMDRIISGGEEKRGRGSSGIGLYLDFQL